MYITTSPANYLENWKCISVLKSDGMPPLTGSMFPAQQQPATYATPYQAGQSHKGKDSNWWVGFYDGWLQGHFSTHFEVCPQWEQPQEFINYFGYEYCKAFIILLLSVALHHFCGVIFNVDRLWVYLVLLTISLVPRLLGEGKGAVYLHRPSSCPFTKRSVFIGYMRMRLHYNTQS